MIERNEFRVGPTALEWRGARWSLHGWQPIANSYAEIERDCTSVEPAFKDWQASRHYRPLKRCFAVIDDSLVRYAMVPSFDEARSIREYQEGARLQCETLLGWSPDKWTVQVSLPPRTGTVLCCAYATTDGDDWRSGCQFTGDADPIVVPSAIAMLNQHRARLTDDGLVAVVARSSCVAVLLRSRAPSAVYQTRIGAGEVWNDDDLQQWLDSSSSLMEPGTDARARYVIDARAWGTGSRLRPSLDGAT